MARNVLIAPLLGFKADAEWRRLRALVERVNPVQVHLVFRPRPLDKKLEVRDHVVAEIGKLAKAWPLLRFEEHEADLLRFESSVAKFAELAAREKGADVTVSLGTGGAPGAVAATVACLLWGWRGVYTGEEGAEPEELPRWMELGPILGMDEMLALRLLVEAGEDGLDKRQLLEALAEEGHVPKEGLGKQHYRQLAARYLRGLERNGFVEVDKEGAADRRHHVLRATREGERAWRVLAPTYEPRTRLVVRGPRKRPSSRAERL